MAQKKNPRQRAAQLPDQNLQLPPQEAFEAVGLQVEEAPAVSAELRDKLLLEVMQDNKAAAPARPEPIEYFPYPEWIDGF